jgi:hypothetical protein
MTINERATKKTLLALAAAILAIVYVSGLLHATLPTLLLTAIVVITYQFFLSRETIWAPIVSRHDLPPRYLQRRQRHW